MIEQFDFIFLFVETKVFNAILLENICFIEDISRSYEHIQGHIQVSIIQPYIFRNHENFTHVNEYVFTYRFCRLKNELIQLHYSLIKRHIIVFEETTM